MWLNIDANTKIGRAHIAFLKRLFISPSGNAIKKVIPIIPSSMYHLKLRVQSSNVIPTAHRPIRAINRKRDGINHWNNLRA